MPAAKVCVVCGIDVSSQKRVKDPQGNYYCQICYDARLADRRAKATGNPETDFDCATCHRFFAVDDVYDEAGVIICKSCFAARTRPARKVAPSSPMAQGSGGSRAGAADHAAAVDELEVIDEPTTTAAAADADQIDVLEEVIEDAPAAPAAAAPADHATDTQWHVHDAGQSHGPFSEADFVVAIQEGRFTTAASIWKEGMENWAPILKVEQLLGRSL